MKCRGQERIVTDALWYLMVVAVKSARVDEGPKVTLAAASMFCMLLVTNEPERRFVLKELAALE